MSALAGWALLLTLGGMVWWYGTPHSPENIEGARGWLSVLRVRFASGSFASWFASLLAPRDEPWDDEYEPSPVYYADEMPAARVSYDGGETFVPVARRAPNLRGPIPAPIEDAGVVQLADGVFASGRGAATPVKSSRVTVASEYRQIGRPTLKNPPVKVDEHKNTRQRMAAWIEEAHDAGGMTSAQIKQEAAQRFGTSLRLAQLAAQDAGLGRGKKR